MTWGERYKSIYSGFNYKLVWIGLKLLNPGLKAIVSFALNKAKTC